MNYLIYKPPNWVVLFFTFIIMKNIIFLSLLLTSLSFSAQEIITLKDPDSKVLKTKFEESNYQMNIILTYLKENFKITKNRYDIKKDKQMGNTECGFTVDFEKILNTPTTIVARRLEYENALFFLQPK